MTLLSRTVVAVCLCMAAATSVLSQTQDTLKKATPPVVAASPSGASKWYDKISLRGYAQMRYNRLFESNPDYKCEQCDRSIGSGQAFAFRRARMIFSGNPGEHLYIYIQFDYSADASSTNKHFLQVRDAYFDYSFDKKKEYRIRFGQSKVPFGFENLQSSQNRLPLDRNDALNSAAPNERDFGTFFYYAPKKIRDRFSMLIDQGLKGSGDYGVFALGMYNGQVTNKPELNDQLHTVARLSYPFKIGSKQIVEPGIQAYTGKFTLPKDQLTANVKINSDLSYTDERAAASFVLYPQPFGLMAEYNIGRGPGFNPLTDSIETRTLKGGYITASYRHKYGHATLIPFVRYQHYEGGKKQELDARYYTVNETEFGVEWAPFKYIEFTASWMTGHRQYSDFKTQDYDNKGQMLRLQVQFNY